MHRDAQLIHNTFGNRPIAEVDKWRNGVEKCCCKLGRERWPMGLEGCNGERTVEDSYYLSGSPPPTLNSPRSASMRRKTRPYTDKEVKERRRRRSKRKNNDVTS